MNRYTDIFNTRRTPQSAPIPGREADMVQNSAGGFTFATDDWARLDRFLILGSESPTYYASSRTLTKENATGAMACVKADGLRTVAKVVEISTSGRAPKNDPALFVLAMCLKLGDDATRKAAGEVLPRVARTGTHLFHFAEAVQAFGGWGRGTKRAFANWYTTKAPDKLAYQLVKYRQRDGWSHRDILRLAKPKGYGPETSMGALLKYATAGEHTLGMPDVIVGAEAIKTADSAGGALRLIRDYNLPREVIPSEYLNDIAVWDALLHAGRGMPMTAMIRNLAKMTAVGLLQPGSVGVDHVVARLANVELLRQARVHPLQVLVALRTYQKGRGIRGSLVWSPVPQVVDALDRAFYATFQTVEPTGKRIALALDVSGSMGFAEISGMPGITPRVGSAAMAMVTQAAEEGRCHTWGFTGALTPLDISPRRRLDDVIRSISKLPFGRTDCAQPMVYALRNRIEVDTFVVYTDNETWAGRIQPVQALRQYRDAMGIPAKLIVVGMISNGFTIADPTDPGMLDVVGFDTATPAVMSHFGRTPLS